MKNIEPGDYFLLPFAGRRRDLLIKAVRHAYGEHWECSFVYGGGGIYLLSSCQRVGPALAKRIMGVPNAQSTPDKV